MDYEWDRAKEALNRRKHGVDFAAAVAALEDSHRLEDIDAGHAGGEERTRVIGMAHGAILFVVTTMRSETACRVISARRATRHEQDRYYAGDREAW
jgi:uncharacterized DUF497 family protein